MSAATSATASSPRWARLLEPFYARQGFTVPCLTQLKDVEVPSPYRSLLVHSSDMTPTLEAFYRQSLGLTVLSREVHDDSYLREVLLTVGPDEVPVEYGAIRIWLDHFPAQARRMVLAENCPLGRILHTEGIGHISWPQAWFRAQSDAHLARLLRLRQPATLYGRGNVLLDGSRRLLAEVIEVLAPVPAEAKTN
jgi:chorismate-pyruvate lyase